MFSDIIVTILLVFVWESPALGIPVTDFLGIEINLLRYVESLVIKNLANMPDNRRKLFQISNRLK